MENIFRARNDSDDFLIHICLASNMLLVIYSHILLMCHLFLLNIVLGGTPFTAIWRCKYTQRESHFIESLAEPPAVYCKDVFLLVFTLHPPGAELFTLLKQAIMIFIFTSIRPFMSALP
jgi:hypothetical protein